MAMLPATVESEADWRKRFTPDLKVSTWHKLTLDTGNYMIKSYFTQNSYEILITDLSSYWYESLKEMDIKRRVQQLNPSIEAPLTKILDQVRNTVNCTTLNKNSELSVTMKKCVNGEDACILSINSILAGMPFNWNFVCETADPDMVSENLTTPLMSMVSELLRRQQELFSIIYKKDKEIEDYRSQGARSSRRYIETAPFNAIGFFHSMNVSNGFESEMRKKGMYVFNEIGGKLYEAVMMKQAWISKSPMKRKAEDELDDIDSLTDDVAKETSVSSWTNRLPPSMAESNAPPAAASSVNTTPTTSPTKDELLRREQLEKALVEQQLKKQGLAKKKKKMAF